MTCPYCNVWAVWVENREVYGRNLGRSYMIWLCRQCGARVGCHNNTVRPLGTMANDELRRARRAAHAKIDPLWEAGTVKRGRLYAILAAHFGREIHIGSADLETCARLCHLDLKALVSTVG